MSLLCGTILAAAKLMATSLLRLFEYVTFLCHFLLVFLT